MYQFISALPTNSAPQQLPGKKMRGDYPNRTLMSFKHKESQLLLLTFNCCLIATKHYVLLSGLHSN